MRVKGLDEVDQDELRAHYARTEALWIQLLEQGIRSRSQGRVEAILFADDERAAAALVAGYLRNQWHREIEPVEDGAPKLRLKLVSPLVHLRRETFMDLVGVLMVSAHHHGCVFDGFQVDVSAVQIRPWWRFW